MNAQELIRIIQKHFKETDVVMVIRNGTLNIPTTNVKVNEVFIGETKIPALIIYDEDRFNEGL